MKIILLLLIVFSNLVNSQALNNGETVTFQLNGNTLSSGLFVDIPETANTLNVEISNGIANSDFDLFMKFGSDFTSSNFNQILNEANYYSAGVDANEYFNISSALNFPLRKGKWYIAVFNFNNLPESINLTATHSDLPLSNPEIDFIFDQSTILGSSTPCNIEGWNDTTPFTPVAGNNATTLGEARKNAALKAAELMTENIQSGTPIIIQGCWPTDLETSATSAVLANASARTFIFGTPGAIENTWYPIALAERQAGTASCKFSGGSCNIHSILINFNPLIDTNQGLGSIRYFYGINSTSPGNDVDFVTTALHEMTHGIGFSSAIHTGDDVTLSCPGAGNINHTVGTKLCNRNDIFSNYLVAHNNDDSITALNDMATDAERELAITTPNKLLWNSELVANSELNTLSNIGTGLAQLYSPSTLSPGSSVSHFNRSYTELMEPILEVNLRDLGLATPVLWDIGWDPRPKNTKPQPGFYYDRTRNGHGFVVEAIEGTDLYFTIFYTYNSEGKPEWYTSLTTLEGNVLNMEMANNTLQRSIYDYDIGPGGATPFTIDDSIGTNSLKIDFNSNIASAADACNDGVDRPDNVSLASWQIGNQQDDWCLEPIIAENNYPTPDFGGTWWAGLADTGWGLSITYSGDVLVVIMYYFDADGNPRWAQGIESGFQVGQEIVLDLLELSGYARDANSTEVTDVVAGSLTLTLDAINGNDSDGVMAVDITYQGSEGGTWSRDEIPVKIFTATH